MRVTGLPDDGARDGRREDDPAKCLSDHRRQARLYSKQRAANVDRHQAIPRARSDIREGDVRIDPSVSREDVDPLPPLQRARDSVFDGGAIGHIHHDGCR